MPRCIEVGKVARLILVLQQQVDQFDLEEVGDVLRDQSGVELVL